MLYRRPHELEQESPRSLSAPGFPKAYWLYLGAGALIAAGFADFSLIGFHFQKTATVAQGLIPVFYAVAMASSRRIELDNWDRSAVNLPFSRIAAAASEPIYVPSDADNAALESARQRVEDELNRLTARAYAIVDRKGGPQP